MVEGFRGSSFQTFRRENLVIPREISSVIPRLRKTLVPKHRLSSRRYSIKLVLNPLYGSVSDNVSYMQHMSWLMFKMYLFCCVSQTNKTPTLEVSSGLSGSESVVTEH